MIKMLIGQKFQLNQSVKRNHTISQTAAKYKQYTGTIKEAFTRKNKLGVSRYYYKVFWEDGRLSEHAQHNLKSI
jgi:hypothetical protein